VTTEAKGFASAAAGAAAEGVSVVVVVVVPAPAPAPAPLSLPPSYSPSVVSSISNASRLAASAVSSPPAKSEINPRSCARSARAFSATSRAAGVFSPKAANSHMISAASRDRAVSSARSSA